MFVMFEVKYEISLVSEPCICALSPSAFFLLFSLVNQLLADSGFDELHAAHLDGYAPTLMPIHDYPTALDGAGAVADKLSHSRADPASSGTAIGSGSASEQDASAGERADDAERNAALTELGRALDERRRQWLMRCSPAAAAAATAASHRSKSAAESLRSSAPTARHQDKGAIRPPATSAVSAASDASAADTASDAAAVTHADPYASLGDYARQFASGASSPSSALRALLVNIAASNAGALPLRAVVLLADLGHAVRWRQ
jgi:hypothetical protein